MAELIRRCPDCGRSRLFAPHHDVAGCPDSADQYCPEWLCVACGASLLIGAVLPVLEEPEAVAAGRRERVA